jgi:hypothetical protein
VFKLSENKLELLYLRTNGLDRTDLHELDDRLRDCGDKLQNFRSSFSSHFELNRTDPHQEIRVFSAKKQLLTRASRLCYDLKTCTCAKDFKLWEEFSFEKPSKNISHDQEATPSTASTSAKKEKKRKRESEGSSDADEASDTEEIGLMELKKQFGFDQIDTNDADDDDVTAKTMAKGQKPHLSYRRPLHPLERRSVVSSVASPLQLYETKVSYFPKQIHCGFLSLFLNASLY